MSKDQQPTVSGDVLTNPYVDVPEEQLRKIGVFISIEDMNLIKSVYPYHGSTQRIVSMYVNRLCKQLRAANLTTYSPDNAARFVALICNDANTGINRPEHGRDVAGATAGIRDQPPGGVNVKPDVQSKARSRSGPPKNIVKEKTGIGKSSGSV